MKSKTPRWRQPHEIDRCDGRIFIIKFHIFLSFLSFVLIQHAYQHALSSKIFIHNTYAIHIHAPCTHDLLWADRLMATSTSAAQARLPTRLDRVRVCADRKSLVLAPTERYKRPTARSILPLLFLSEYGTEHLQELLRSREQTTNRTLARATKFYQSVSRHL